MNFLEQFLYVIKYKNDKSNVVVDALSRRHNLFSKLEVQILGFDHIFELYNQDYDLSFIFASCQKREQGGFYVSNFFFFKEGKLCITKNLIILVKETHERELMGHFGVDKTLSMLQEKLFWHNMRRKSKDIIIDVLHALS